MKTLCVLPILAALTAGLALAAPKPAPTKPASPSPSRKVIVTYFHGNARCVSCRKIEAWTEQAVVGTYLKDIQAKRLEWRIVNVDEKANQHYLKDYKLYTKSVVVSDVSKGKETRWKNLDKVWNLLGDEAAFKAYVKNEVDSYLKAK